VTEGDDWLPADATLDDSALAGMGSGLPGLFITFEGLDGTGKTTQLDLLAAVLREAGYDVLTTREPGGTALGEGIRRALLDVAHSGMAQQAEALLYMAARAQLVHEVIRPALAAGRVVLADRYLDSTLAYQGYGRDLGADNMMALNIWATDCLFPDLTLVLFAPPAERQVRVDEQGQRDRLEAEDDGFFARVEAGYRRLVSDHPHRLRAVDGDGSVAEVHERIRALVLAELDLDLSPAAG